MIKNKSNREKLLAKISGYVKKKSLVNILTSFFKSMVIGIVLFVVFSLSETVFYFSPSIKTTFILVLLFVTLGSFFIFSGLQIKKYLKANSIDEISIGSKEIGNHFSNIKDTLLNSLQLI